MNPQSLTIDVTKVRGSTAWSRNDCVAVEEPLEIRLGLATANGRVSEAISVTMRTPGNDTELALGFLKSEAIISSADDIAAVESIGPVAPDSGNHNIVRVDLKAGVTVDLGRLQRNFYTTSSCGVCGKSSLDALSIVGAEPLHGGFTIAAEQLVKVPDALRETQNTFDATGGLHAAALFDSGGTVRLSREDVGRHNAVDKIVGAMLEERRLLGSDVGLMVSGRASFELLQKALMAGIPMLAAVGAPSSLAVRLAAEFNVTLVGFLRGDHFNIYTARDRVSGWQP